MPSFRLTDCLRPPPAAQTWSACRAPARPPVLTYLVLRATSASLDTAVAMIIVLLTTMSIISTDGTAKKGPYAPTRLLRLAAVSAAEEGPYSACTRQKSVEEEPRVA